MKQIETRTQTGTPEQDPSKLVSLLWLFTVLNMLFKDVHDMVKADTLEGILTGHFNGLPVTDGALLVGGILVQLPLLMFLLGHLASPVAYRRLNLALAPLALLATVTSGPDDLHGYFFMAVMSGTFAAIVVIAWKWMPTRGAGWRMQGA